MDTAIITNVTKKTQTGVAYHWPKEADEATRADILNTIKEDVRKYDAYARHDGEHLVLSGPEGKLLIPPGGFAVFKESGRVDTFLDEAAFDAAYDRT